MKSFLTLTLLLFLSIKAAAQTGSMEGIVKDEKGNPIRSAIVEVREGRVIMGRTVTSSTGHYRVDSLRVGLYDLRVGCKYYDTSYVVSIPIFEKRATTVDIALIAELREGAINLPQVMIKREREPKPLIEPVEPGHCSLPFKEIEPMPSRSKTEEQSLTLEQMQPGKLPEKRGIEWTDPGSRTVLMGDE